mmetsp:Transcript_38656/g.69278  ORF Transcript_38656/g.69278 Transcript_38656/m.69278 type:complete len:190 (-) Transcript_38656:130-699(-)
MSGITAAKEASNVVTKDDGTRVIAASRRPDGSIRKERRVRSGYTPQDEQPVYESRGKQMAKGVIHPPGFFPEDEAKGSKPVSKSAKKNAARKAKKAEGGGETPPASELSQLSLKDKLPPPQQHAEQAAAAEEGAVSVEKKIRNLKKRIRQCDSIQEKVDAGKELTPEEQAKLHNRADWEAQVAALEAQL